MKKHCLGHIDELLDRIRERPIPTVSPQADVCRLIQQFVNQPHSRIIYVVDSSDHLLGVISLGALLRHVFHHYHEHHTHHLISMATSETAEDFLRSCPVTARAHDDIEDLLRQMMKHNIKEIPVIDHEGRIIADLTMVDLLDHYIGIMGSDYVCPAP